MRSLVPLSLIALSWIPQAGASRPSSVFELRGFAKGSCFRHPAVRTCRAGKAPSCRLELFASDARASLRFALRFPRDALVPDRATTDYGIFVFETEKDDVGSARIVAVERVPLSRWAETQDASPLARPVACESPGTQLPARGQS